MLTILLAAALLTQDPSGFSDEDIVRMNQQWAKIAAKRKREEGLLKLTPRPLPKGANRNPGVVPRGGLLSEQDGGVTQPRTGPLRGPRPSYNRPRTVLFVPRYPAVMPAAYTIPPFIRR